MKVRPYTSADYPTIRPWWEGHGVQPIHEHLLPPLGVVVEVPAGEGGLVPVAVAWVYLAVGVPVGWLAWLTSNPELPAMVAARGVVQAVKAAEYAAPDGIVLFVLPEQDSYRRLLETEGFVATHACTEMFKAIRH